jgi:hypothetical protein
LFFIFGYIPLEEKSKEMRCFIFLQGNSSFSSASIWIYTLRLSKSNILITFLFYSCKCRRLLRAQSSGGQPGHSGKALVYIWLSQTITWVLCLYPSVLPRDLLAICHLRVVLLAGNLTGRLCMWGAQLVGGKYRSGKSGNRGSSVRKLKAPPPALFYFYIS